MKVEVHKKVYHLPVKQIEVPEEFQNQSFEVIFMPIAAPELKQELINTPNPALKNTVLIYDDISALDNDWDAD